MSDSQNLIQSARPEKPKMSRMAEFAFMLGGRPASWGVAIAVVGPVVGHLQPMLGMPHLTVFAGLVAAQQIAKGQRRLAKAAASLAGERTLEQEKNMPKVPYWTMVGHVSEQSKKSTGLLGALAKLGITVVGGLWLATKLQRVKASRADALGEATFKSVAQQFQSGLATGKNSMAAEAQKIGGRGSEYYAWLNASVLLSMSQPTAAAKLWEQTRFNPKWGCPSGEKNQKLPFADALEAVLKKTAGHSAKAVMGGVGANGVAGAAVANLGNGTLDTFILAEDETDVAFVEQIIGLARSTIEAREIRSEFKPQINQTRLATGATAQQEYQAPTKPHRANRI